MTAESFEASAEHAAGAIDLTDAFGPMAAMHAALDAAGIGMPCGLVARFEGRAPAEVDAAVRAAARLFPILRTRLAWASSRPALAPVEAWTPCQSRANEIALSFSPDPDRPLWRYALTPAGPDVWLAGIWAHAAADGRSMLHFLGTVAAALEGRSPPVRMAGRPRARPTASMARWLPQFLIERHLPYVRLAAESREPPGLAWLTLPRPSADEVLARARAECGGFAAWLAAAACMAFCEQQRGLLDGRVSLNLLVSRGDLTPFHGFGFGVGSLLMPVRFAPGVGLGPVARRIFARQQSMMAEAWDEQLHRFIGRGPGRRRWFASLEARGLSAPTVSVSWKGVYSDWGARVGDVACFAASNVAHVSAHGDAGGLSISVTSRQSAAEREALLRRVATIVGGAPGCRVFTLDELFDRGCDAIPAASAAREREAAAAL